MGRAQASAAPVLFGAFPRAVLRGSNPAAQKKARFRAFYAASFGNSPIGPASRSQLAKVGSQLAKRRDATVNG